MRKNRVKIGNEGVNRIIEILENRGYSVSKISKKNFPAYDIVVQSKKSHSVFPVQVKFSKNSKRWNVSAISEFYFHRNCFYIFASYAKNDIRNIQCFYVVPATIVSLECAITHTIYYTRCCIKGNTPLSINRMFSVQKTKDLTECWEKFCNDNFKNNVSIFDEDDVSKVSDAARILNDGARKLIKEAFENKNDIK